MPKFKLVGECADCCKEKLETMKERIKIKSASAPKPLPGTRKWYIEVTT